MKTDLSPLSLSKEANSKCEFTLTINLSDLLVISSCFIGFCRERVSYICFLKSAAVISYKKNIKDEISKGSNVLGTYKYSKLKEVNFSKKKNKNGIVLKFPSCKGNGSYFAMDLEVIEFLVNNCIKNGYLPKSKFLVLIDTNLGTFEDKELYSLGIDEATLSNNWYLSKVFINFSNSCKKNPVSYYLGFFDDKIDLLCAANQIGQQSGDVNFD